MKCTHFIALLVSLLTLATQSHAADTLSFSDARHLITRTGFGASPSELNQFIGLSRNDAVSKIVSGLNTQTQTPLPSWTSNSAPHHHRFGKLPTSDKQKFRQIRRSEIQSLRRWWIQEMIATPSPQTERLVLFWHNHFATAYSALNHQAISILRQHRCCASTVLEIFGHF